MCLLAMPVSSSMKCLFKSFACFFAHPPFITGLLYIPPAFPFLGLGLICQRVFLSVCSTLSFWAFPFALASAASLFFSHPQQLLLSLAGEAAFSVAWFCLSVRLELGVPQWQVKPIGLGPGCISTSCPEFEGVCLCPEGFSCPAL